MVPFEDHTISDVTVVETAQKWYLNDGNLMSSIGRRLYTDGEYVKTINADRTVPNGFVPVKCTTSPKSTADTAVLDCKASTSKGTVESFVICDTDVVQASASACEGSVAADIHNFILGPPRASSPAPSDDA